MVTTAKFLAVGSALASLVPWLAPTKTTIWEGRVLELSHIELITAIGRGEIVLNADPVTALFYLCSAFSAPLLACAAVALCCERGEPSRPLISAAALVLAGLGVLPGAIYAFVYYRTSSDELMARASMNLLTALMAALPLFFLATSGFRAASTFLVSMGALHAIASSLLLLGRPTLPAPPGNVAAILSLFLASAAAAWLAGSEIARTGRGERIGRHRRFYLG